MDLIRRIVAEAPARMSDDAVLVLEVGHERAHFERAFPRLECAWLETSAGDDCVVLIERRALLAPRTRPRADETPCSRATVGPSDGAASPRRPD